MKYLTLALLAAMLWVGIGCRAEAGVGDDHNDTHKAEVKVDKN
jgi:hypothetical protein